MKVTVGSRNPVKVEAVKNAFNKAFGECTVVGVSVSSGVSDMPMSFDEYIEGAKSRAKEAIDRIEADFGVGLEGGFEETKHGTFMSGCVAIIDKKGRWGLGGGTKILMPSCIVNKVREGIELGDVMDELCGTKNIKQREGATGYFTKNLISRTKGFENATIFALARFLREQLYWPHLKGVNGGPDRRCRSIRMT